MLSIEARTANKLSQPDTPSIRTTVELDSGLGLFVTNVARRADTR
jgi:hypothetical protein